MKEELEKLGFEYIELGWYSLYINDNIEIQILLGGNIYLVGDREQEIFLFHYNYEKLKQLIQILS